MNDLASEFFYEGVAHLPPGLLIIVLYWRIETENVFHTHPDLFPSPLLFIACVLAIAWLVGLMVEAIIYVPTGFVLSRKYPCCKLWNKQKDGLDTTANSVLNREKRRQFYFKVARIIMCRDLSVIFLYAWLTEFIPWHPLGLFQPSEHFSNLHWKGYYFLGGFLAFALSWFLQNNLVIKKKETN